MPLEGHEMVGKVRFAKGETAVYQALLLRMCLLLQKHLIPQLLEEHGLTSGHLSFPQPILHHITRGYTREVSVRAGQPACIPMFPSKSGFQSSLPECQCASASLRRSGPGVSTPEKLPGCGVYGLPGT